MLGWGKINWLVKISFSCCETILNQHECLIALQKFRLDMIKFSPLVSFPKLFFIGTLKTCFVEDVLKKK